MSNEVLLEIKPQFNKLVRIFSVNLIFAAGAVYVIDMFLLFIFIAFSSTLPETFSLPADELMFTCITLFDLIIFILVLPIFLWLNKKNYDVTSYKVYNDRIEFEEGFINHKFTTIKMEDVKEIHLTQNFLQKYANLATIRFVTPANNASTSTGVTFMDIENSNYVYAKLKQIQENK